MHLSPPPPPYTATECQQHERIDYDNIPFGFSLKIFEPSFISQSKRQTVVRVTRGNNNNHMSPQNTNINQFGQRPRTTEERLMRSKTKRCHLCAGNAAHVLVGRIREFGMPSPSPRGLCDGRNATGTKDPKGRPQYVRTRILASAGVRYYYAAGRRKLYIFLI